MGFKDLKRPEGMAESRLYKQAGNAVVVPVIERIAHQVKIALGT
jgi:DNA (cytosine-5)-methyltransferase 1